MQTTYPLDGAPGVPGLIGDSRYKHIDTCFASEEIPAGRAVVYDAATGRVALPSGDTQEIYGVAVFESTRPATAYPPNSPIPVMRQGSVWMEFSGGVATPNATPTFNVNAAAPATRGTVSGSAVAAGTVRAAPQGTRFSQRHKGTDTLKLVVINFPAS